MFVSMFGTRSRLFGPGSTGWHHTATSIGDLLVSGGNDPGPTDTRGQGRDTP